jgi:hypothetical protein
MRFYVGEDNLVGDYYEDLLSNAAKIRAFDLDGLITKNDLQRFRDKLAASKCIEGFIAVKKLHGLLEQYADKVTTIGDATVDEALGPEMREEVFAAMSVRFAELERIHLKLLEVENFPAHKVLTKVLGVFKMKFSLKEKAQPLLAANLGIMKDLLPSLHIFCCSTC